MRRGYTKEAYLTLAKRIREEIPNVTISSDFIVGFCGETEHEFNDTLEVVENVGYEMAFNFCYSLREKTKAHRTLIDDISPRVKKERLARLIKVYERRRYERVESMVGRREIVLIEKKEDGGWIGRSDGNIRVTIKEELPEREIKVGDFVVVETTKRHAGGLIGHPISFTSLYP
jgi:tRNA A37 methylthiotransferase MiaB